VIALGRSAVVMLLSSTYSTCSDYPTTVYIDFWSKQHTYMYIPLYMYLSIHLCIRQVTACTVLSGFGP